MDSLILTPQHAAFLGPKSAYVQTNSWTTEVEFAFNNIMKTAVLDVDLVWRPEFLFKLTQEDVGSSLSWLMDTIITGVSLWRERFVTRHIMQTPTLGV